MFSRVTNFAQCIRMAILIWVFIPDHIIAIPASNDQFQITIFVQLDDANIIGLLFLADQMGLDVSSSMVLIPHGSFTADRDCCHVNVSITIKIDPPKFKWIGSVLLLAAVRISYTLGLEGRVWLTSVPAERTKEFYRKKGFEPIFTDEDGMVDFELPKAKAESWLKHEGYLQ